MQRLKFVISCLCIVAAVVSAQRVFSASTLLPIFWSLCYLAPLVWLRRSWLRWALIIPITTVSLLVVDSYFLRHRLAVEWRTWSPFFDITHISEVLVSPSGRTTVYLINSGFTDSSYSVYVSSGSLFPIFAYLVPASQNMIRGELDIGWNGSVFTAGHKLLSFAYSEDDDRVFSYEDWIRGAISPHDPPKTIDLFSAKLSQLKNGAEQAGTGQPATRSVFESEGSVNPQPEAEGRSR
jgi:hypothetical protein